MAPNLGLMERWSAQTDRDEEVPSVKRTWFDTSSLPVRHRPGPMRCLPTARMRDREM